jgi:lactonase
MRKAIKPNSRTFSFPLPPDLTNLPTMEAEPWLQISPDDDVVLEGPAFDTKGNLFVTSPSKGLVYKITQNKQISTVFDNKGVIATGAAFHKDGRLFIVCLSGELLVINPDTGKTTISYPKYHDKNLTMNDIVFDDKGNFYITDFTGTMMEPTGGVYRLSEDAVIVQPILQNLASPNGISLAPNGRTLWVGETTRNTVICINLMEDGITLHPIESTVCVYHSTGYPGPDSNKVDSDGNVYQCIMGQGRIVVLNEHGIPIANVVVRGRAEGKYLRTANLAFKPDTCDGYITTSGEGGAWIFKFVGLAKGLALFSH